MVISDTFKVTANFSLEPGASLENHTVVGSQAYDSDPSNNAATADRHHPGVALNRA